MGNETTETTSDPRATFTQRAQRHRMDVFSEGNGNVKGATILRRHDDVERTFAGKAQEESMM